MEPLEQKVTDFVNSTIEQLKAIPGVTEKMIDERVGAIRTELKEYVDKVNQNNVSLGLSASEVKQFSFFKAFKNIVGNVPVTQWDEKEAGFEREVIIAAHQKASVHGDTGAAGGYLIPVEVSKEILEPSMANTVMASLGITTYTGLTGDFVIPGYTSRPTLSFGPDGTIPNAQSISHIQKYMKPKTGKMLVKVSDKLRRQSANVAEQVVRSALMDGIELGIDNILINGTGTDSQPMGILNHPDIPSASAIGNNGGRLRVDKVASMIADIQDQDYLKKGGGSLLTHPRVLSGLKRERVAQFSGDTAGMPLINPLITDAMLKDMLGLGIFGTTSVAKNIAKGTSSTLASAIVGEWAQFVHGMWGGMRLRSSDMAGDAFTKEELWILACVDMDSYVKYPTAFNKLSDCETLESAW